MASQHVSDLLRALSSDDAHRSFLEAHIRFYTEFTNDACYVLVDSTDGSGACDMPMTKVSNYDGVATVGFRLIAVVWRSKGPHLVRGDPGQRRRRLDHRERGEEAAPLMMRDGSRLG